MKKRIHFLIVGFVFIIALILGSFYDKEINAVIFDQKNLFGLIVSSFGMMPGYGFLAFAGGITLFTGIQRKNWNIWGRIGLFVFTALGLGFSVYALGKDVFSINGFYNPKIYWLGFVIMGVLMIPVGVLGFFFAKKAKNPYLWLIAMILCAAIFVAIIPGVSLLKSIMHRPRYRFAVHDEYINFHHWWEPCKNYEYLIGDVTGLTKEEFKSFPSGHSGAAMITVIFCTFLACNDEKLKKFDVLFFYIGFTWCLVVMFARMLVGAHYLSDTVIGASLTLVCFYIANEFIIRYFMPKEEQAETPQIEEKVE